ncbi:MAG: hypothetical protein IPG46_10420 [Actinobacteria bacterium]|nr:hypothetical protein [Actinomycetota bacterium]
MNTRLDPRATPATIESFGEMVAGALAPGSVGVALDRLLDDRKVGERIDVA